MRVEIHKALRKPSRFSVVLTDEAGRYGIVASGILSFSEARSIAQREAFDRGIVLFNRVEDAVKHGRAGARSHITSFL